MRNGSYVVDRSTLARFMKDGAMNAQEGISLIGITDDSVARLLPPPLTLLNPEAPLFYVYIVNIREPTFAPWYMEGGIGLMAKYGDTAGLYFLNLQLSGPGAFSVDIGGRTQREAQRIGLADTIGLVILLLLAYRSWKMPLLGALPLASAGIAGLGAVALLFPGGVHGITIAFGFTLIGVVQDYPIHLFSHQRAGVTPWQNARAIWPTLATGVASTCIAYVTFLLSGVDGLQQLAVFTIIGLLTAARRARVISTRALTGSRIFRPRWPPEM